MFYHFYEQIILDITTIKDLNLPPDFSRAFSTNSNNYLQCLGTDPNSKKHLTYYVHAMRRHFISIIDGYTMKRPSFTPPTGLMRFVFETEEPDQLGPPD